MRGAVLYGQRGVRFEERAVPTTAMIHIAIQEQLDGKAVDWMEKGTDEHYRTEGYFGRDRRGRRSVGQRHRSDRSRADAHHAL